MSWRSREMIPQPVVDAFWARVDSVSDPTGCWEWQGPLNSNADMVRKGRHVVPPARSGLDHWTKMQPELARDRMPRGARHGNAKLTEAKVHTIKSRLTNGAARREIARDYGVSVQAIHAIAHGRNWAHVA